MFALVRKSVEQESSIPEGIVRCRIRARDGDESARVRLLSLVGEAKRVLILGRADASLRQALQEQGCEVTCAQEADEAARAVAQLGELLLPGEEDDASFDVALAAGSLEQLRDPLAVLKAAKKYLRPEGCLIAAVPNVAHGNVRLALLGGRFPYPDAGPHRETPLRFFTYDSLVGLFEEADFAVGVVERQEEDVRVPDELAVAVPPDLLESVSQAPEARTAQFITLAYPLPRHGLAWLQSRLRTLAEQYSTARTEAEELRQDLEAVNSHLRMVIEQQEASLRREKESRARLLALHDQMLRRDEEYRKSTEDLQTQVKQTEAWWQARLQEAERQLALRDQAIHQLVAHQDALAARLDRFRRSLAGRAFKLVRRLLASGAQAAPK
jgi:SAM-dependent methyltransferase